MLGTPSQLCFTRDERPGTRPRALPPTRVRRSAARLRLRDGAVAGRTDGNLREGTRPPYLIVRCPMHRNATPWLRGLLAALGLVCVFGMAKAQPGGPQFDPTHYWTYHILDQFTTGPQPIFVKDQFFKQGVAVTVDSLDRLLNWVQKNNSAVTDTLIHYTWWNIIEKLPVNRLVTVTNQFGSFPVQVLNLEFLLAPALKHSTHA